MADVIAGVVVGTLLCLFASDTIASQLLAKAFMLEQQWHYSKHGQTHGPITSNKLKELAATGEVHPTDLVWRDGMDEWQPASNFNGLFPPRVEQASAQSLPPLPNSVPPTSKSQRSQSTSAPHLPPLPPTAPSPRTFWSRLNKPVNENSKSYKVAQGVAVGIILLIWIGSAINGTKSKSLVQNGPVAPEGPKLAAFRKVVDKYHQTPGDFATDDERMRFATELSTIQSEFEAIRFDPKANRKDAQAIIELYQKEIENRYRGEMQRELEILIRSMYEKMTI